MFQLDNATFGRNLRLLKKTKLTALFIFTVFYIR